VPLATYQGYREGTALDFHVRDTANPRADPANLWRPASTVVKPCGNSIQGSCSGYEIRSTLAFTTLRRGPARPILIQEAADLAPEGELVGSWHPRPGNPFHGRLLKAGPGYAFWASDAGWYVVDPFAPSITATRSADPLRWELRLFGVPTAICAFEAGDISIHASAVEIDGKAVLLAGPSMHGKTTLAAALVRGGHRLLSEDTTRCSLQPAPSIYPGPAALRLRADVARSFQIRGATVRARDGERVVLVLDERLRGDAAPVPLAAIVFLRRHATTVTLERADTATAIRDLFALSFRLRTPEARAASFSRVVDLTARAETLDLSRPLTIGSTHEVVARLEEHVRRI
jgi:hypothetical protein